MALFVHLTARVNAERIRRAGLRGPVYCFPVLPSFTLTYQWTRELARWTPRRGMVAVHLRVPDAEPVTVGRYNDTPRPATAAEAVARIAGLSEARGWEVVIDRKVGPREIHAVRDVPQGVGWRYKPDAHGVAPCVCFGCRPRGTYGSRRLVERRPHPLDGPAPAPRVLLERLEAAGDSAEDLLPVLDWYAAKRRGPVERVRRLAEHPDPRVREYLAWAVGFWRTPGAVELIERMASDEVDGVREAAEYMLERRGLRPKEGDRTEEDAA
ncbi:hypothetical protein Afil01_59840 [Actinorhabdospora filicis]|uniref:HEAT repeat domain-containing protein n=1 Tax=Actinorhabdospora filicis TaxID=1785913 RepID=A0A9W6SRZ5_9ACTN|nr:HEAT repeat domain-containing protein [Actinorhabdospora filicis]GLZ81177.1 hypothetical protein Afil01_59840 [Actinorhabdospora filicis]